jgi:hypothetical protein
LKDKSTHQADRENGSLGEDASTSGITVPTYPDLPSSSHLAGFHLRGTAVPSDIIPPLFSFLGASCVSTV